MDDLISRKAAIDAAIAAADDWDGGSNINRSAHIIVGINNIPAVDAVPVAHGKWIEKRYTQPIGDDRHVNVVSYFCSACNGEHYYGGAKYCPNCGAKMDGDVYGR